MDWKYYTLPLVAVLIIGAVYYSGVLTGGNVASSSVAITAVEVGFGVIGAIAVGAGLIYTLKDSSGDFPSFQYANIFAMYLPVTYILVGILVDIVSQKYGASAASVTAIAAVTINKIASMLIIWMGGTTQKLQEAISQDGTLSTLYKRVYQGCTVPGFENLESVIAPQSLVIIFSLFMFFALEIGVSDSGQSLSGLIWMTITAVIIQLFYINTNHCLTPEFYWKNTLIVPFVFSLLIGGIVGGLGWTANYFIFNKAPIEGFTSPILPKVGDSTSGKSGTDDDSQFVCEAYKNGELVTSTIAE